MKMVDDNTGLFGRDKGKLGPKGADGSQNYYSMNDKGVNVLKNGRKFDRIVKKNS